MRRLKTAFTPYVSDAAAFTLLALSLAVVVAVAAFSMTGKVHEARQYQSTVTISG